MTKSRLVLQIRLNGAISGNFEENLTNDEIVDELVNLIISMHEETTKNNDSQIVSPV